MPLFARHFRMTLFIAAFAANAGLGQTADPSAAARDNIPRIWRALSGDQIELDGKIYDLSGVSCPDPTSNSGRKAKALLNIFLLGGKHSPRIICMISDGTRKAACKRGEQTALALMTASGLCEGKGDSDALTDAGETLTLIRATSAYDQVSYWRLRSCIGVHPDRVPMQCRLASRTWPLRYAEAAQWLERQNFSRCHNGSGGH